MKMLNFKKLKKPFTIAEIGGNHEGNFEYAKKLCDLARKTNVDCIKFQLYSANGLVNPVISPTRNSHFKKFELTKKQYIYLAEMCIEANKYFSASIWSEEMISYVIKYLEFFKFGSGDMNCYPLINSFLKYKKPLVISTGLATIEEVNQTRNFIIEKDSFFKNDGMINFLQCTTMYPINDFEANVSVMTELKKINNIGVGYSDHTEGYDALLLSAVMGANILEFHFTDTRENKSFRDHKVSLTPKEANELIHKIEKYKILKGQSLKQPLSTEINNGHVKSFRRAIYLNKDMNKGEVVNEDDLVFLRPMEGISSVYYEKVIGKTLLEDIKKYQKLDFKFFN